jgi:hypothetical protein
VYFAVFLQERSAMPIQAEFNRPLRHWQLQVLTRTGAARRGTSAGSVRA